jgi:uroporphyrin-III C-methyltransferase
MGISQYIKEDFMKRHPPSRPDNAPRTLVAPGSCTLVGAGPGDPELLTLKALKAIRAATVLLVDDLVSDDIVAFASPSARVIHVGKRGGCKSTPQPFIEKLMITAVREGEHVVRLKGGDPFIFGRGGEEVQHLHAQGIQVEVINGITAGLAAATSLGVALTHREHAHGVLFITGHPRPGVAGTDWPALGLAARQARLTLVIYMGVSGARRIQDGLLGSLPGNTPVALIQNASLPGQRHAVCPLCELQATLVREQLTSPCVIVVGDVLRGLAAAQLQSAADHRRLA